MRLPLRFRPRILGTLATRLLYGIGFRLPWAREPLLLRVFSTPPSKGDFDPSQPLHPDQCERWYDGGSRFRAVAFGEGALVFLVHGWGGSIAQMLELGLRLAQGGFRAVLIELPAHGASGGRTTNAYDAARAIRLVAHDLGDPFLIVAHSFGALGAKLALDMGLVTRGLVLIAPLPSLVWAATDFARQIGISAARMREIASRFVRQMGANPEQVDLSRAANNSLGPLLIVHDRQDRRIPISESEKVVAALAEATLARTEGLGHTRILASPDVHARVLEFALARLDAKQTA
jgi:pimeloyl-ACP methyl ester carboxylesterase